MGIIRKKDIRIRLVNSLLFLFLIHGCLFFLYPQDLYNINSPIRYIKYIVIMFTLILVTNKVNIVKILYYLYIVVLLLIINKIAVNKNFNIISFLNYMIPLSVFFFYSGLSKYSNIQLLVKSTYMISTIFSYIEFIILDGYFTRFASSGYRVVSIFVNPNNFGIVMVILTVYLLSGETIQKIQNKLFVLINSLILIYLSGSRSAILIITVTGGIYFLNKIFSVVLNKNYINIKNIMYLVIGSLLFIAMLIISRDLLNSTIEYLNSKSRNLQIGLFTGAGRLYQINKFIDVASSNINFPWRNFIIYVDNIYLHIWGMFGLPILILFIFFNIYLLFKTIKKAEYYKTLLIIVFLTAGLSTNIFYLWPIAYIYWYLVGDILYIKSLNF